MHCYGLCSYDLHTYGLCSSGQMIMACVVMAYVVMAERVLVPELDFDLFAYIDPMATCTGRAPWFAQPSMTATIANENDGNSQCQRRQQPVSATATAKVKDGNSQGQGRQQPKVSDGSKLLVPRRPVPQLVGRQSVVANN